MLSKKEGILHIPCQVDNKKEYIKLWPFLGIQSGKGR
jgi:hypothetical protein